MTSTIDLAPIMRLSVPERIEVVQTILDSIANDTANPELSEEMKAELDRRLADSRANPDADIPWEQVKAEILSRSRG